MGNQKHKQCGVTVCHWLKLLDAANVFEICPMWNVLRTLFPSTSSAFCNHFPLNSIESLGLLLCLLPKRLDYASCYEFQSINAILQELVKGLSFCSLQLDHPWIVHYYLGILTIIDNFYGSCRYVIIDPIRLTFYLQRKISFTYIFKTRKTSLVLK